MAQPNFKRIAEELEKATEVVLPKGPSPKNLTVKKPIKTKDIKSNDDAGGSGGPWDVPKEERLAALKAEDVNKVVRAVLEYALSCADDHRTPVQIGEAVGLGIEAASKELNVPEALLAESLVNYLTAVSRAAKSVVG